MKENVNLDEKYIINPAYFIRMDNNRAILSDRGRIELSIPFEECFTFLYPLNAQMLTFFNGKDTLHEVINSISNKYNLQYATWISIDEKDIKPFVEPDKEFITEIENLINE